jgi:hypothetical protein
MPVQRYCEVWPTSRTWSTTVSKPWWTHRRNWRECIRDPLIACCGSKFRYCATLNRLPRIYKVYKKDTRRVRVTGNTECFGSDWRSDWNNTVRYLYNSLLIDDMQEPVGCCWMRRQRVKRCDYPGVSFSDWDTKKDNGSLPPSARGRLLVAD